MRSIHAPESQRLRKMCLRLMMWRETCTVRCLKMTIVATLAIACGGNRCYPVPPTEVFRGVTYECVSLDNSDHAATLAHIVRVDLTAPGIELYISPFNRTSSEPGHEYFLNYVWWVQQQEELSVAINGPLFVIDHAWLPIPGRPAASLDTVVVNHDVSHVHEHSYLLWFNDGLQPRLEKTKPPGELPLRQAKWGIGGQGVVISDGKVSPSAAGPTSKQAMIAIDSEKQLLWLAACEKATPGQCAKLLALRGAQDAILFDSGNSVNLALDSGTGSLPHGNLIGGYRPVTVVFGVRAQLLP